MSHLGRPKGGPEDKYSLRHTVGTLEKLLGQKVIFGGDCIGEEAAAKAKGLMGGEVLLLENLRFYKEEEKGDLEFSKKLSTLGDIYVNDAFGTAHRAHASTAIIAKFFPENKMFGFIMEDEVRSIDRVLKNTERPFTAILGGAKVSGKIEIINNLIDKVDNLLIGGGMMFTFIKGLGGEVGSSLVEDDLLQLARETSDKAEANNVKLYIPQDAIAANAFSNDAEKLECGSTAIPEGWMGLDIGPNAIQAYREVILNSKTILWNGPMGVFEMPNFEDGTKAIAEAVAEATKNGAFSLIGGGDSVAAINKYNLKDQVSYVSTGGGAMLEYIEGKILPGVAAIEE